MKLLKSFNRSGIRTKLTIVMLLMTLLPLCAMFLATRISVQQELRSQYSQTYARSLNQVSSYASDKACLARSLVTMLCGDVDVQAGTSFATLNRSDYDSAWYTDISHRQVVYSGYLLGAVSRVYLYSDSLGTSFCDSSVYGQLTPGQRLRFERWLADDASPCIFLTMDEDALGRKPKYLYLIAKIPSVQQLDVRLGLIQANLSLSMFENILKTAPGSPNTTFYLLNGEGQAFLQAGPEPINTPLMAQLTSQLAACAPAQEELATISLAGRSYLAGIVSIAGTDWHAVMLAPTSDMANITRRADSILLLTIAVLLMIILPATALVARSFTKPILSLRQGVQAIADGDYTVTVPPCDTPEINQVIDSFNLMVESTREMMAQQYEMGQSLKSAEMQVLQEQINPHFLYNTLDLLHWQARKAGAKDIDDVVYALSEFYKLSLGRGEEIVTIDHELRHVSAYLRIQNIRFANRIRLTVDVEAAVRDCSIVKLVLQPLVENCIQHGIREKDDESGTIVIRGWMEDHDAVLTVSDDGIGMDAATLSSILTRERAGYGVRNVNDRLVLHYGSAASLRYESVPGKGTTVTLRIPDAR